MSYQVAQAITDIRSEFEGGKAFQLDFFSLLRRGANNVLDNINPETLKRRTPIYGGIGNNLAIYYCPADVEVPSAIYRQPNDPTPVAKYVPPSQFFMKNEDDTFTIEYINGVRFLIFRKSVIYRTTTLDEMDAIGTKVSDQTLRVNNFNYISGTGALQRTFSERGGVAVTSDNTTGTFTSNNHGLVNGDRIKIHGTLPVGVLDEIAYFVTSATAHTFKISLVSGGSDVFFTTNGSGLYFHYADRNEISDTLSTPLNIVDLKDGVAIIPMIIEDVENISGIEFVIEESTEKYYVMTSSQDSVGDNLIDGLNMVRFEMNSATEVGTVDDTNITKWRLRVWTKDGTSQTIIVDKLTLQRTAHYYFEYYSNRLFIDGTTGAWKDTPTTGDYVNLNRDTRDILHYETVILVAQGNTKIRQARSGFDNFTAQLSRKYNQYWSRHPSSEMPLTYNNLHDDDCVTLPERIGGNMQADITDFGSLQSATADFVDNETPTGTIDGANNIFSLSHIPNPQTSLLLWLNGVYQTQGTDYTLSGQTITFTIPPAIELAGMPFVAFYRY